jgi:hypothetical protein
MDVKTQIEKAIASITGDSSKIAAFKKDPVAAVKKVVGDAVSTEIIDKIIAGVKAKLAGNKLAGAADAVKNLFKK